jgi:hypothetical protein
VVDADFPYFFGTFGRFLSCIRQTGSLGRKYAVPERGHPGRGQIVKRDGIDNSRTLPFAVADAAMMAELRRKGWPGAGE